MFSDNETIDRNEQSTKLSFLALGDSYTIGESVDPEERWGHQLSRRSLHDNLGVEIGVPEIVAETGWTTKDLIDAIHSSPNLSETYDLVSILIGVNNQYRSFFKGDNQYSLESYAQEFVELVDMAMSYAADKKDRIFVLSIPDYSATPFVDSKHKRTVSTEVDKYNNVARLICNKRGITFIDITEVSRLPDSETKYVAKDLLHPSGLMYSLWVEEIVKCFDFVKFS